jgi:hypothetical protein
MAITGGLLGAVFMSSFTYVKSASEINYGHSTIFGGCSVVTGGHCLKMKFDDSKCAGKSMLISDHFFRSSVYQTVITVNSVWYQTQPPSLGGGP